jgi:hypothetical protein
MMKKLITLIVALPALCSGRAPYTEQELWRGVPVERLPLDSVRLVVRYDPATTMGISGREVKVAHRIAAGMRNVGTNLLDEVDVTLIFTHGTMSLQKPDGEILTCKMALPISFRQTWAAIKPGEETFFFDRPMMAWFPALTNSPDGLFVFWWEVGTNTSERLQLQKTGAAVTLEK